MNLAFSHQEHLKKQLNSNAVAIDDEFEWREVFLSNHDTRLLGHQSFPALLLDPSERLPLQETGDCWNCGFGVLAATACILRDVVGYDEISAFDDKFCGSKLKVSYSEQRGEWISLFPMRMLKKVPISDVLPWGDYLTTLRVECFVVYDRLAELQHVILPRRSDPSYQTPKAYTAFKEGLLWPNLNEESNNNSVASTLLTLASLDVSKAKEGTPPLVSQSPARQEPENVHRVIAEAEMETLIEVDIAIPKVQEDDSKLPAILNPDNLPAIPRIEGKKTPDFVPKAGSATAVLAAVKGGRGSVRTRRGASNDKKEARDKSWNTIDKNVTSKKAKADSHTTAKKRGAASSLTKKENVNDVKGDSKKKSKRPKLPKAPSPLTEAIFGVDLEDELRRMEIRSVPKVFNLNSVELGIFSAKYRTQSMEENEEEKTVEGVTEGKESVEATASVPAKEAILDVDEMEKFVAAGFAAWEYDTEDRYNQRLEEYANTRRQQPNKTLKMFYLRFIQALKKERRQARARFEREYKFSKPAWVKGIRYNQDKDQFTARIVFYVWSDEEQSYSEEMEYMPIEEQWFADNEFDEEMVKHIINLENDDGYVSVPMDLKPVRINKHAVCRVKYVPSVVREYIDISKIEHVETEIILKERTRSKAKKNETAATDLEEDDKKSDEEREEIAIPTRKIPTNAHWIGKLANGETTAVTEEFVTNNFGEAYTLEMKLNIRGYVDVPVGDFKVSHLHEHPHLRIIGAPTVAYVQSEGMDLCVPKALASVLHWLGFCDEATKINDYGEQTMSGGTLNAMDKIRHYAAESVLPKWIQVSKMQAGLQWEKLLERDILLAVLTASDGNQNHAVAIHGGYIYDANEVVAIPLCQESLNYCTSTSEKKSTFKEFRRGIFLSYNGSKKGRITRMTLPSKRSNIA